MLHLLSVPLLERPAFCYGSLVQNCFSVFFPLKTNSFSVHHHKGVKREKMIISLSKPYEARMTSGPRNVIYLIIIIGRILSNIELERKI